MVNATNSSQSYTETAKVLEDDLISGSVNSPLDANEKVVLVLPDHLVLNLTNTNYKFQVVATDEAGNQGHLSNVASYCNKCYVPQPADDSGLSGGAIGGIVVGVILAIVIAGIAAFVIMKKNRGEEISLSVFKKGKQTS